MSVRKMIGKKAKPKVPKEKKPKAVKAPKIKSCTDCPNFKWMPHTDFEAEYTQRSGISRGSIVFILSPIDFFNLKRKMWQHIIGAALQEFNILFLPYPRCIENVLQRDKVKLNVKRMCKDNFILKKLEEFNPDLIVVTDDTKDIMEIDDKVELAFPGNWVKWLGRRVYLAKDFYSPAKGGFWQENFQHTCWKIRKFFDNKLIWQRQTNFRKVLTLDALEAVIEEIKGQELVSVDVETSGLDPLKPGFLLKTIGIGWPKNAICIGVDVPECVDVQFQTRLKHFMVALMADQSITKVAHNLKFEMKVFMTKLGIVDFAACEDTMFLSYLFDENRPSNKLKYLVGEYCDGYDSLPENFENATYDELWFYNCMDCYFTLWLKMIEFDFEKLGNLNKGIQHLYYEVMLPGCYELARLELAGVSIDYDYIKKLQVVLFEDVAALKEKIEEEFPATRGRNLGSNKQLGDVLFGILKYPEIKRTKTGPSVDKETLVTLAEKHSCKLATLLLESKKKEKQLSTYVTPYIENRADYYGDKVRSNYSQVKSYDAGAGESKGTTTGRLSSSGPNLQNIPRDKQIKRLFIPSEKSRLFLQCDLSQAELRIAASYAFEENMLEIYRQEGDIHEKTGLTAAPPRFLKAWQDETDPAKKKKLFKEIRQVAKPINFGLLYGGSSMVLQRIAKVNYGVEITEEEAAHAFNAFFAAYPGLVAWHESTRKFVERYGMAIAPNGRVRRVPNIIYYAPGDQEYESFQRQALNATVQSVCSDFLIQVWSRSYREIRKRNLDSVARLTVHDSLVSDVKDNDTALEVKEIFTEATKYWSDYHRTFWLKCNMRMDFELGSNWGALEEGF